MQRNFSAWFSTFRKSIATYSYGKGWINARNNLEETFDVMEHIYCIEDMKKGIISKIFK